MLVNKKVRDEYIDVARGAVILLMLVGHSGAPKILTQFIYGFHMPFFFILSGYLYNHGKWEARGLKELVRTKFKAYMIPYFILCGINIILEFITSIFSNGFRFEFIKEGFTDIIWDLYSYSTRARMGTSTPLWFLPCIFLSTIFVYLIFKIKRAEYRISVLVIAWVVNIGLNIIKMPLLPWHFGISLVGASFMILGFYIRNYFARVEILGSRLMLLFFVIYVVCTLENGKTDMNLRNYGKYPMLFILGSSAMTICVIWFFKNVITDSSLLQFFGRNTMIVMGFNYAVNAYYRYLLPNMEQWYWNIIVNIAVISAIIYLYNKIKKLFMLIFSCCRQELI